MIIRLKEKPEKVFDHIDMDCIWLEGHDDFGLFGYGALKFVDGRGSYHLEFTRFSMGVYESMKRDWPEFISICKENGCKVLSVAPTGDVDLKQWTKLIKLFGFPEPKLIPISEMKI